MKTTRKKTATFATAAAASVLLVVLTAAFRDADQGYNYGTPRTDQPKPDTKPAESQPARYNKATGIIGMDVRNPQDERLGEIRDVVFDLPSERVAYAVMNSGSPLLGRGKLLAVPLSAFSIGADQKHLVLRADKAKLESAQGLERDNWPAVASPSWGAEPFWEKEPAKPGNDNPDKSTTNPKPESTPRDK